MDPVPSFLTVEKKFPNQILQISQDPVGILYSFRNIVKEGTENIRLHRNVPNARNKVPTTPPPTKRGESDAFGNIL